MKVYALWDSLRGYRCFFKESPLFDDIFEKLTFELSEQDICKLASGMQIWKESTNIRYRIESIPIIENY